MPISLEQLGKIRGVSLDELRVRSRQRFAKLSDRLRRARAPEMSDDGAFQRIPSRLARRDRRRAADTLRCRLRARNRRFLPSLEQRGEIVEMMNRRFPDERDAIIKTAESALAGRFSLLGHGALEFRRSARFAD